MSRRAFVDLSRAEYVLTEPWFRNHSSGVEPITARRYEEEARARKIQLTLVEPPQIPSGGRMRSYGIPPLPGNGTLVARIRSYPSSLDRLLRLKRATYRALELYQREAGDPDLLLPPFCPDPDFMGVAPEEPFPNLVYKLPELEAGRGVYFLKASPRSTLGRWSSMP